jgi:AraC-like DNA-binding protein
MTNALSQTPEAKGVLYPNKFDQAVSHWQEAPPEDLHFLIEHYWGVHWDLRGQPSRQQEVLSYPSVHMSFEDQSARFVGVVRGRFTRVVEGAGWVFGVKFQPGAFFLLLRSSVASITNKTVSIDPVFSDAAELKQAMWNLETIPQKIDWMNDFFRRRGLTPDAHTTMAREIVRAIQADRELRSVEDVCEQFSIQKRGLQRLFQRYVGVSPKWVIQRFRLQEAADLLRRGEALSRLTYELGYCDQAHFSKDFKAIVGASPAEYAARCGAR